MFICDRWFHVVFEWQSSGRKIFEKWKKSKNRVRNVYIRIAYISTIFL